jgi:hypothetical protein
MKSVQLGAVVLALAVGCSPAEPPQVQYRTAGATGAAQPLESDFSWLMEVQLMAPSTVTERQRARTWPVAIDGDLLVVGMPTENKQMGAAYVFEQQGGLWFQQAVLTPPAEDYPSCLVGQDCPFLETAVAVSRDSVLILAPGPPNGGLIDGVAGYAYVFDRVGTSWVRGASLPTTGQSDASYFLSISDDTAVLGGQDVFVRAGSSWKWAPLEGATAKRSDPQFGGCMTIAKSAITCSWAKGDPNGSLARTYSFVREEPGWLFYKQPLEQPIEADLIGLQFSDDTLMVQVTTPGENDFNRANTVRALTRNASKWEDRHTLGTGALTAVSASGDTVVLTDPTPNSARVFVRAGSHWSGSDLLVSDSTLVAAAASDQHVALRSEAVSAEGSRLDRVHMFEHKGSSWEKGQVLTPLWRPITIGSVSASGERVVIGGYDKAAADRSLVATVFLRSGTSFLEEQHLSIAQPISSAPDSLAATTSVAIFEDRLVLSPNQPTGGVGARVLVHADNSWIEEQPLIAADGTPIAGPTALSDAIAVVGVPDEDLAYIFVRAGSTWIEHAKLKPPRSDGVQRFGSSLEHFRGCYRDRSACCRTERGCRILVLAKRIDMDPARIETQRCHDGGALRHIDKRAR